jgi:acetyl-CoA acetyltransferase
MDSLTEVFVYEAIRTPRGRGKPSGKLHTHSPLALLTSLLQELRRRYPALENSTDEVIVGCCEQFNDQGGNLARSAALQAGYQITTPGLMVSRFCGSGLDAVNVATAKIMAGQADLIVAGGVEMLSLVSIFGSGGPMASDITFKDATVQIPQGLSADLIATLQGYSRKDVDTLGAASQQRASMAWSKGWFSRSVVRSLHSISVSSRGEDSSRPSRRKLLWNCRRRGDGIAWIRARRRAARNKPTCKTRLDCKRGGRSLHHADRTRSSGAKSS